MSSPSVTVRGVRCGSHRHRLRVTGTKIECVDHDETSEAVAVNFGGVSPRCVEIVEAVRFVHRKRRWKDVPVVEIAELGAKVGGDRVRSWSRCGVVTLDAYRRWREVLTTDQAIDWWADHCRVVVPDDRLEDWLQCPAWHVAGWLKSGVPVETALLWKDAGVHGPSWHAAGFTPEEVAQWQIFSSPTTARGWRDSGVTDPREAQRLRNAGFAPTAVWVTVNIDEQEVRLGRTKRSRLRAHPHDDRHISPSVLGPMVTAVDAATRTHGWDPTTDEWLTEVTALTAHAIDGAATSGLLVDLWDSARTPAPRPDTSATWNKPPSMAPIPPPSAVPSEDGHRLLSPGPYLPDRPSSPPVSLLAGFAPPRLVLSGWRTKSGKTVHLRRACSSAATVEQTVSMAADSRWSICGSCWSVCYPDYPTVTGLQAGLLFDDASRLCTNAQQPWVWADRWALMTARYLVAAADHLTVDVADQAHAQHLTVQRDCVTAQIDQYEQWMIDRRAAGDHDRAFRTAAAAVALGGGLGGTFADPQLVNVVAAAMNLPRPLALNAWATAAKGEVLRIVNAGTAWAELQARLRGLVARPGDRDGVDPRWWDRFAAVVQPVAFDDRQWLVAGTDHAWCHSNLAFEMAYQFGGFTTTDTSHEVVRDRESLSGVYLSVVPTVFARALMVNAVTLGNASCGFPPGDGTLDETAEIMLSQSRWRVDHEPIQDDAAVTALFKM